MKKDGKRGEKRRGWNDLRGLTGGRRRAKNSMTNLFIRECLRVFPESTNSLHRPFSFHFRSFNVNDRIKSIECFSLFFFLETMEVASVLLKSCYVHSSGDAKKVKTTRRGLNKKIATASFFFFFCCSMKEM